MTSVLGSNTSHMLRVKMRPGIVILEKRSDSDKCYNMPLSEISQEPKVQDCSDLTHPRCLEESRPYQMCITGSKHELPPMEGSASNRRLIHLAVSLSIHWQTCSSLEASLGTQIHLNSTAASSLSITALTAASKHFPAKTAVQVRVTVAAMKYHDQKQLWIYLAYTSTS